MIETVNYPVIKSNLQKVIISPPFGNYLKFNGATSVLGSFTIQKRKGAILQFIKTFRKYQGGYINKIGLRNKGFININFKKDYSKNIISLATLSYDEWNLLGKLAENYFKINLFNPLFIELNLSCPNVNNNTKADSKVFNYFSKYFNCIVKLPPSNQALEYIEQALNCGINHFHLCNTIPSLNGGISGSLLKEKSLYYIQKAREAFKSEIKIIGGGGIYNINDIKDYQKVSVDYFSVSTIVFKNFFQISKIIDYCNSQC